MNDDAPSAEAPPTREEAPLESTRLENAAQLGNTAQLAQAAQTRSAGRGGLAVAVAKIYFILVGFVQQIVFKAILGLDGYGAISTALSVSSITYNPITQASIQGVSREIAGVPQGERALVLRRVLRVHALLAVASSVVFFLAARPLAIWLGAPHVAGTLRILSSILFLYGIYTPLVGALNGLRRFLSQAALDVLAATLRTAGLLGGAYWGSRALTDPGGVLGGSAGAGGTEGAAVGFTIAALVVLLVALALTGVGQPGGSRPQTSHYLRFLGWLLVGQVLLNLLFQADALLLRRFAANAAASHGLPLESADPLVGAYRAAQLFGFLPYQLLMSVTFILFPLLAQARAEGDRERVRTYVREGVRIAVLLSGLMASVLVAVPEGVIAIVYGPTAAELAGGALRLLALGLGTFAVFGVMTAAQNSLGGERGSLVVTAAALALVVLLCFLFASGREADADMLTRTAWATTLGLVVATLLSALRLWRLAGGVAPALTVVRALVALATSGALGAFVAKPGIVGTLLGALTAALVYLAILTLSRELHAGDAARLRAVIGRRAAS